MPTPDYLQMLRMRNIFGPQTPIGNDLPQQGGIMGNQPFQMPQRQPSPISFGRTDVPIPPPDDDYDMMSNYTPEHAASDRFNQMVMNYPQMQEPSKKRKFGAAVLGSLTDLGTNFGGNKTGVKGTDVFDETTGKNNWRESVGSWKEQIAPLQQAANLERYSNANERQLAYQAGQTRSANRRLDITEQNNQARQDVARQRATAYEFKARNPNHHFEVGKDGYLRAIDPITNQVTNLGKTGLDQSEIIDLNQKNAIARIDRQGDNQMNVAETRGWKPFEQTMPDGTKRTFMYNEVTGERRFDTPEGSTPYNKPTGAGSKETGTQEAARLHTNARQFKQTNPELGKWVTIGPGGDFTIKPPKTGMLGSGPSRQQYDQIVSSIWGPRKPPSGNGNNQPYVAPGAGGTQRYSPGNPPKSPLPGHKYIPKDGGGWTLVPE